MEGEVTKEGYSSLKVKALGVNPSRSQDVSDAKSWMWSISQLRPPFRVRLQPAQ